MFSRRWLAGCVASLLVLGVTGRVSTATAGASGLASMPATVDPTHGTDWSTFHFNDNHSGVTPDTTISSTTGSNLRVQWQANLGSASYGSPAVAYDTQLAKTLVYAGDQGGYFSAFDATTGARVWDAKIGSSIQSSPLVANGTAYVGASDHMLHAYNATTGAPVCSYDTGGVISSSPVLGQPAGSPPVIYVGDSGLTGGDDGGAMFAINALNCTLIWKFTGYSSTQAGTWSPVTFTHLANGTAVVLFGGSSPDCAEYEVNATTGALLWRFQTQIFSEDDDVGAGSTISAPGVNGFADGVVYVAGKDKILYALNLATGAKIWEYDIYVDDPLPASAATRGTPALDGTVLYLGAGTGMYAINAVTGAKIWRSDQVAGGSPTAEIISSPAVTGAPGNQLVLAGDVAGNMYGWSAASGALRWEYKTAPYVYASPAVDGGQVYFTSGDGFLYAFGFGGAFPNPKPVATVATPANGSTISNTGSITVTGTATDDSGVSQVLVAVQDSDSSNWWDPAKGTWTAEFNESPARLSSPGAKSTNYSFTVPDTANGGPYLVTADAVDTGGQHNALVATSKFSVVSLTDPPTSTITQPTQAEVFYFPNPSDPSFNISVTGTSTDTGGAHPGVAKVFITVKNIEHGEYYCGSLTCGGSGPNSGEFQAFSPTYTVVPVPLANPGAENVNWSIAFPTFPDPVPFGYRIVVFAEDNDGNLQPVKSIVNIICVNNVGNNRCVG